MKNYSVVAITIVLLVMLSGCQHTTDPNITEEIHNASISSGELWEYQTGISGDEEGATIVQQPQNYEISAIVRDSTTNWEAVYQYKPEPDFTGTDYVELKLSTGSDGASPNNSSTLVKLNITVN